MYNGNYDEYDDEYDDYPDEYGYTPMGGPSELYFFGGSYKIRLIENMPTTNGDSIVSCVVEQTEFTRKPAKSLLDVYEYFDNSFFLEFLITLLVNYGVLQINKCKKLINVDEDTCCIYVTAHVSSNQMYCKIEDEIESDEQTTDIIHIGKLPFMRTHQNFYSVTQAIKYSIVKYNSFNDHHDWTSDSIDWFSVYRDLIEPYIISMMCGALKITGITNKNINEYKNYMEFHVQYMVTRQKSSLYCEIYILPKTVFGHTLLYNMYDGRKIYIGVQNKFDDTKADSVTSDVYRICAGSQNLNLLPLNIQNLKLTYDNGSQFIVLDELPTKNDSIANAFILNMNQYTHIPLDYVIYIKALDEFAPFTLNVDNKYNLTTQFLSLVTPDQLVHSFIQLSKVTFVVGTISFYSDVDLPVDIMIKTTYETKEASMLPWGFYEAIQNTFGEINEKTKFVLVPIRALPKYREFMLIGINNETEKIETQSDIINKKEETDISNKKKHKFFKFW